MAPSRLSRGPTPVQSDLGPPPSRRRVSGLRESGSRVDPLSQPAVGLGEGLFPSGTQFSHLKNLFHLPHV